MALSDEKDAEKVDVTVGTMFPVDQGSSVTIVLSKRDVDIAYFRFHLIVMMIIPESPVRRYPTPTFLIPYCMSSPNSCHPP